MGGATSTITDSGGGEGFGVLAGIIIICGGLNVGEFWGRRLVVGVTVVCLVVAETVDGCCVVDDCCAVVEVCCVAVDVVSVVDVSGVWLVVDEATDGDCGAAVGATDVSLAVEETSDDPCSDVEGTDVDVFRLDFLVVMGATFDDRCMVGDAIRTTLLAVEEVFFVFLGCTRVVSPAGSDTGTCKAPEDGS